MDVSGNERESWYSDLTPGPDEPLFLSLVKYRMAEDRWPDENGNLLSSKLKGSKLHAPIIDLDGSHAYVQSTTDGHAHLYLHAMPRWRMFALLIGLRIAGVIEMGNFWWSIRRGATFVRKPGVQKPSTEHLRYSYGMFFRLRTKK